MFPQISSPAKKMAKLFFFFTAYLFISFSGNSQVKDTVVPVAADTQQVRILGADSVFIKQKDTSAKRIYSARRAAIYSAVLPGLGQIYNKKYWKLPLVYTAIGIPTYTYFWNKSWYNKARYALAVIANQSYNNADSVSKVDPKLQYYITLKENGISGLINIRDEVRKNQDYSVLFILLFWGLNVVDATVDAHLKGFDVSDEISLHLAPSSIAPTNSAGLSLVFDFHQAKSKPLINLK